MGIAFSLFNLDNPFSGILSEVYFSYPLATSLTQLSNAIGQLNNAVTGQPQGGLYSIFNKAENPLLTYVSTGTTSSPGSPSSPSATGYITARPVSAAGHPFRTGGSVAGADLRCEQVVVFRGIVAGCR